MKRAVRRWLVIVAIWAAVAAPIAYAAAYFVHTFDICIPEWGGCPEEDRPLDLEFLDHLVTIFVWLWAPIALLVATALVFLSLASAVAADFRAGRHRRQGE